MHGGDDCAGERVECSGRPSVGEASFVVAGVGWLGFRFPIEDALEGIVAGVGTHYLVKSISAILGLRVVESDFANHHVFAVTRCEIFDVVDAIVDGLVVGCYRP